MFSPDLPKQIGFAVVNSSSHPVPEPLPEERQSISDSSSQKRLLEFRNGRHAARKALATLGIDTSAPILADSSGKPIWPNGVVGSISHTGTIATAMVAYQENFRGVGIDVEHRNRKISSELANRICLPAERDWINSDDSSEERLLSIFSGKESCYKAFQCFTSKPNSFQEVETNWNGTHFNAELRVDSTPEFPTGFRFSLYLHTQGDYLFTWTYLT